MTSAAFELHTTPLSANGRKVLAQARHLGLEPIIHDVNVYRGEGRRAEYLAINPTGKIPTLVEGDFRLSESNAILEYVSAAHAGFRLSSEDARERATIESWLFWESAHWQPVLSDLLAPFVAHALLPDRLPPPEDDVDWRDERLAPLLGPLETHLGRETFLALGRLSNADLAVAGMTTYFRAAGFPFDRFPNFAVWYRAIESLDAWKETAVPLWTTD